MHSQFRNSIHSYTRIEDPSSSRPLRLGGPKVSPQRDSTLTPVPEEQTEDEESIEDYETYYTEDTDDYVDGYGQFDTRGMVAGPSQPAPSRYEPLPAIDSGEPLRWETYATTTDNDDPFMDTYNPSPATYDQDDYASYDHGKPGIRDLSRPTSSVYDPPIPVPSNITGFTQASQYEQYTPPATIDYFRHDTEAYASGSYPSARRLSAAAQSRSPTPAVDDEDYYVVDDSSYHYTGESPSPLSQRRRSHVEDPEKGMPSRDIGAEGTSEAFRYAAMEWKAMMSEKSSSSSMHDKAPPPYLETRGIIEVPGSPETTRHFGPAPVGRIHRRNKLKKRVQLTNGNLVVDLAVPPKMVLPRRGEPEMMKTRYTAVTCDPDDFEKRGFFLRQNEYGRSTELFIVVTMYNEDEVLFCRTLYGVMRNVSHLCSRKNSRTWGQDSWQKVVVCIVADGRKKVNPRVLDCLTLLGIYQPGDHMKNMVNNKPVTAHLFEYTTSFGLDPDIHFKYPDKGVVPCQILFCMKEKNQKKINSHRWFFNAFGPLLQPNICVLLDVGTMPGKKSIYHLWKAFDVNSNVGGACGEIAAYKGKRWSALLNPLVASQNFEYKITNILDKPTESLFGYITVLPGAFSAYRYIALQNDKFGMGPLASYFKGEVLHGAETDIFTSNMYLAEDRILCFELVAKANSHWILKYVKSAIGETDVPDALPEFISQRRRWLNGSLFAAMYAIVHAGQILQSGHSIARKCVLMCETVYNVINLVATWFAIGNFYLFFVILTSSLEDKGFGMPAVKYANAVIQYCMASIIIASFLFSMGNKPKAAKWKYKLCAIVLAVLMCYMIFGAVMCSVQAAKQGGEIYSTMLFSIIATYGVYFVSSFLAFDPWHMFTSFIPYMLLSPTYINILNVFAFANLDDISWGTKQDTVVEEDLGAVIQNSASQVDVEVLADIADVNALYEESLTNLKDRKPVVKNPSGHSPAEREQAVRDYYASVRTNLLLVWVLSNGLLVAAIIGGGDASSTFSNDNTLSRTKAYMTFILAFVAITSIVRFTGSTLYLIARVFTG